MMSLHWVDIAILAIIGLSILTGLFRGFVKEFISLCVWILASWLAYHYMDNVAILLKNYFQDETMRRMIAFAGILIGTLVGGGFISILIGFILKRSGLSGMDRILGMTFGLVRGVLLVSFTIMVVKFTALPHEMYAERSVLMHHFNPIVAWMGGKMPEMVYQMKQMDKDKKLIDLAMNVENA